MSDQKISEDIKRLAESNNIILDYGFILTRHVVSTKTNKYWNHCVKLIRSLYPDKIIVIIDDCSDQNFLFADYDYKNVITIQSEYPRCGELLPYVYYSKSKWFDSAVIIHDSVFLHNKFNFEKINLPAIALWNFEKEHNKTHLLNNLRIADALNYSDIIKKCLTNNYIWRGCFGVQCFIKHKFLLHIMEKYNIENLLNVVKCREDRCSLERIFAVIFYLELRVINTSLFGNIDRMGLFGVTFDDYYSFIRRTGKLPRNVIKVFTGR